MLDAVNKICSSNVDLNLQLHGGQTLDYCQNKNIVESVNINLSLDLKYIIKRYILVTLLALNAWKTTKSINT